MAQPWVLSTSELFMYLVSVPTLFVFMYNVCLVRQNNVSHVCLCAGDTVSLFQFMENVAIKIHVPSKWKRVGVAFGLGWSQIDAIEKRCLADSSECYSDVFEYWQETFTHKQPANWASLVSVLRSNYVGEERLVEYIQETFMWHCCCTFVYDCWCVNRVDNLWMRWCTR